MHLAIPLWVLLIISGFAMLKLGFLSIISIIIKKAVSSRLSSRASFSYPFAGISFFIFDISAPLFLPAFLSILNRVFPFKFVHKTYILFALSSREYFLIALKTFFSKYLQKHFSQNFLLFVRT